MEQIKLAKMTGSEKQIAWATDIITNPYNIALKNAESLRAQLETYPSPRYELEIKIWQEAAKIYKEEYETAAAYMTRASQVIDLRNTFPVLMNRILSVLVAKNSSNGHPFAYLRVN